MAKNFSLTKAQESLLEKGLTFIPSKGIMKGQKKQLKFDLQAYHRKLKLSLYFEKNQRKEKIPFLPKSDWEPPDEKLPPEILALIKKDNKDLEKYYTLNNTISNLSKEEQNALKELQENKHIVIKPADKGNVIVILSRDQYIEEAKRQLSNKNYYKKLNNPIYLKTVPLIKTILIKLYKHKFINKKQMLYLQGDGEPRPRRFYILPKIHKQPENWTVPFEIPPGRPIISDCDSETYYTAEYIDKFLTPLSTKHPSYVRDTYHFIELINNLKIPQNSFMFTIDIDNLYTNIDIPSGLKTVKDIFNKYPDPNRPDPEILKLLKINLTRNDFEFNNTFYLQIKGTAMGKRFAPAYANIFLADWEGKAFTKCKLKPLIYLRYLDDIFGVWTHTLGEFMQFIKILDSHDASIKLKYTYHHESIDYLDTTIFKGESFHSTGKLDIKVFFKKTDTHALLYKTSHHPKHTFKGLIKSQILKYKRICSQPQDFWKAVKTLFHALRSRGYSRQFLRNCLKSIQKKPIHNNQIIPLITTYSINANIINRKIKRNFENILHQSGLLSNHNLILAYRKNKNLKDYLVRAKLRAVQELYKANDKRLIRLKFVENTNSKKVYKIDQEFNWGTSNCIYMICCDKCNMKYIGETKNSISTRITQHKYNILNKKQTHTPLVAHFIMHGWDALKVAGIQSNTLWTESQRKIMEIKWINKLDTKEPRGLNSKS